MNTMAKQKALTTLVLLFTTLILNPNRSLGSTDTISVNRSLSGDQTIISSGGVFELGFFKPGRSSKYYIGMWYKELVKGQPVIWVANRESPVSDKLSSELKISDDGNLILLNEKKVTVWSTNTTTTISSRKAVLLNTGILVLIAEGASDGKDGATRLLFLPFIFL